MMMNSDSRNTSRLFTGGLRCSRLRSIHSRKLKALSAFIQVLKTLVLPVRQYTGWRSACVPAPAGPCLGPLRRTPLMTLRQCVTSASALWLTLLPGMPVALAQEAATPPETAIAAPTADSVQAIWKHQEISFYFQSFTTFYSCTGLEGKLERVMKALGVHAKVRVRSADCPSSVARMPRVVMKVASPVEATPEAYAERDKNKSVRELTERVKGGKSTHPIDSLEEFPAQW